MNKPVQYFTDEYLAQCRKMTPTQIAKFLEEFRQIAASGQEGPQKLISMRVTERLLSKFKAKCARDKISYQKKIKELMNLNGAVAPFRNLERAPNHWGRRISARESDFTRWVNAKLWISTACARTYPLRPLLTALSRMKARLSN